MSSYTLTEDEYNALAFSLDHHIPRRTNKHIVDTEFDLYFLSINYYVNQVFNKKIEFENKVKKYM